MAAAIARENRKPGRPPGPVEDFELPVRGERHQQPLGPQGVGKTTTASAVALADAGGRTLIISTDSAFNLDDLFGR